MTFIYMDRSTQRYIGMTSKLVLYGCGELGLLAKSFFEYHKITFTPVDVNPATYDTSKDWAKYKICTIDKIPKDSTVLICISTHSYNDIKKNLLSLGFTNVMSFFEKAEEVNQLSESKYPIRSGWIVPPELSDRVPFIKSKLYDKKSRIHYEQFHVWHREYKEEINKTYPIDCKKRYFIDEITKVLNHNETLIDTGAYDGRVSLRFISETGGRFNKIHCIEPDTKNRNKLVKNLTDIDRVTVHNFGLGSVNKKIGFSFDNGYVSSVDYLSKKKITIKKLDSIRNLAPTVIKYHLEGYELDALRGSIDTIIKYRPIVMVTTYHTVDGIYDIPNYLIDNLKNYRFLWRNHNYMGQGSVMYCIPEERYK